jgi:nucleotide-binding universal stress UspA family protein
MYRTIIVPLDGSSRAEKALAVARRIVDRTGADLVVASAVPWFDDVRWQREDLRRRLDDAGVYPTRLEVAARDRPCDLVAELAGEPETLVVMASHGHTGLGRAVLGSVTEQVVHDLDSEVLVVGPEARDDVDPTEGRVMVPVDDSDFALTGIEMAQAWVERFALEPWVVQVLERSATDFFTESQLADTSETGYVHRLSARFEGLGPEPQFEELHGSPPWRRLVDFAAELPASLIAMSTHGRTGLARVALGSQAMAVVRNSPCPVLLRRPVSVGRTQVVDVRQESREPAGA